MQLLKRYTGGDRVLLLFSFLLLLFIGIIVFYPLLFVVSSSLSASSSSSGLLTLWPIKLSLIGYQAVFDYPAVWSGYLNSMLYMSLGTLINLFVTICAAYPLSRKDLIGRNSVMVLFVLTMYFSGGLIPTFLLVNSLGMLNTIWAMIIPGAMSVYNMIVMRTYFGSQIPEELRQAAEIDGCGTLRFLIRIVLPLSGPILAVIGLFYAVGHWNAYFNAMIYIRIKELYPLQLVLREILIINQTRDLSALDPSETFSLQQQANLMRYSLIVVASLPVMLIYPFVQKFFVKGIMLGALKG